MHDKDTHSTISYVIEAWEKWGLDSGQQQIILLGYWTW